MFHLCVDVVSDFSDIVRCVSIDIHRATLYALLTGLKVGAAYQNSVKIFTNFLSEEFHVGQKIKENTEVVN